MRAIRRDAQGNSKKYIVRELGNIMYLTYKSRYAHHNGCDGKYSPKLAGMWSGWDTLLNRGWEYKMV